MASPKNGFQTESRPKLGDDHGSYTHEKLGEVLGLWADANPEFTFEQGRTSKGPGYHINCPGNMDAGWPDGNNHSEKTTKPNSSASVWVENGHPRFRCGHNHCDQGALDGKKTWKHLQQTLDPGGHMQRRVLRGVQSSRAVNLNLPTSTQESGAQRFPTTQVQTDPGFKFPKVPGRVCEYVLLPLRGRFDGPFGRGRISIIGGSSGAGKTSLMSELLFQQQHRKLFLGHQGGGLRPLTIFADRGELSNMETMDRLGLLDAKLPIAHLSVCFDGDAVRGILDLIEKQDPLPEVVFVEGADALVSDAAKTQVVAAFLSPLQRIAEHYHIAIVLSVGAPKSKPREQHTLKRDRIFGSQIWPRMADTIVTLECVGDGTGSRRDLTIQHRNAPSEMFELEFQNGRLVPHVVSADIDALEIWMLERGDGAESWFTRGEAVEAMSKAETGLQRSAVYARIKEMLASRRLEKRYNKARGMEELQLRRAPMTPDEIELQEALKDFSTSAVQIQKEHQQ